MPDEPPRARADALPMIDGTLPKSVDVARCSCVALYGFGRGVRAIFLYCERCAAQAASDGRQFEGPPYSGGG